jgi:protein-S-isoprenylcysteine O-methyltransferase Ste14
MHHFEPVLNYRPPRIAFAFVLSAAAIHLAIPVDIHPGLPLAAAFTGLAGFLVMLRAWWLFRSVNTAICPTADTAVLVTDDVFSISRNPMYLGMSMMLIAVGLFFGALAFYVAAAINFAVLNRHFCPYEEDKLRKQFGERFNAYEKRVRRWL